MLSKIKSKSIINSKDVSNDKIKNDLIESKDETDDLLSSLELNLFDDSSDIKLNFSSRSSKAFPIINKTDVFPNITEKKNFQKKIKTIISEYMKGYYIYYVKNIIDKIIKEYEKYSSNLSDELIEEEVNYYNQERQMEYLRDEDESYIDQIEGSIKNIKEEKQKKIIDIYEKHDRIIKNINEKYLLGSNNNFYSNEVEILKEKMKLELTKEINNSIFK